MKISRTITTLALGALLAQGAVSTASAQQAGTTKVPAINFADMDKAVRPQTDFYHYVNGGWIRKNPLKPAYSRFGTFDVLRDTTTAQVHRIIAELTTHEQVKGTNNYRVATLYNQAMDSVTRNRLGAAPIKAELTRLGELRDKVDVLRLAAELDQTYGEGTLFSSYVGADEKNSTMNILALGQTSLGLHTRDYYVEQSEEMKKIRSGYEAYLVRVLTLAGYSPSDAQRIAHNTLKLETELAQFSYSNTELRDTERNYNMLRIQDFAQQHTGFDWAGYFKARGLELERANFSQLDFFKAFDKWYAGVAFEELRDFLIARAVSGAADALSDEFVEAKFDFFGKQLSGKKEMHPRWKRSLSTVEGLLGEALGEIYVKQYFSPEAKERMLQLVRNLQTALGQRVEGLSWMSPETKQRAKEKLSSFVVKIGYPDKWKDYSSMEIDAA